MGRVRHSKAERETPSRKMSSKVSGKIKKTFPFFFPKGLFHTQIEKVTGCLPVRYTGCLDLMCVKCDSHRLAEDTTLKWNSNLLT